VLGRPRGLLLGRLAGWLGRCLAAWLPARASSSASLDRKADGR
jgi:hypothetical protein